MITPTEGKEKNEGLKPHEIKKKGCQILKQFRKQKRTIIGDDYTEVDKGEKGKLTEIFFFFFKF